MYKDIIFSSPLAGHVEEPKPSSKFLPEEYKKMPTRRENKSMQDLTVKACMPFLDSLTVGYIIPFPIDTVVDIKKNEEIYDVNIYYNSSFPKEFSDYYKFDQHGDDQFPQNMKYSQRSLDIIFKIVQPWHIKTPPGYSCIITQPFNKNLPFKIIDAIVDTDTYELNINLPGFYMGDVNQKEILIPKGTPLALVIPFKRDTWKMKMSSEKKLNKYTFLKYSTYLTSFYKRINWVKKRFY